MTPSFAQPRIGDTAFEQTFDQPLLDSVDRQGEGTSTIDNATLRVEAKTSHVVRYKLPLDRIRGKKLTLSADVRAVNVAKPPRPWNGVKVMVHSVSPSGPRWDAPSELHGSFDTKRVSAIASVPTDVTEAWIVLGLEEAGGTVWFDNVRAKVTAIARSRPTTRPMFSQEQLDRRTDISRFRGVMYGPHGKEEDLRKLKEWNVNFIRWQLFWVTPDGKFDGWRDMAAYDKWLDEALTELERWLPLCDELGIKVLVDLHTPPGGNILLPDMHWPLFAEKHYQDRFLQVWDEISTRLKKYEAVWGYDLANEPGEGDIPDGLMNWRQLAEAAAKRVRAIDEKRAIVVPPGQGGGWDNLDYFEPLPVDGVIYTVHMYVPHEFTHQGVMPGVPVGLNYPGHFRNQDWNKAALKKVLQPVRDYQLDYNVPILLGEFSAIRWAPDDSARQYLSDCIDIFEEFGWDWSYHAFREWHGWSVEHDGDRGTTEPAKTQTSREKLLRGWFGKNR